jgi:uncharacterized protein GlcG (DUF336 family)
MLARASAPSWKSGRPASRDTKPARLVSTAETPERERARQHSAFWASVLVGQILLSPGGMPVTVTACVIGGIGCGGGTGEQGHECAVAGAAALAG